MAAGHGLHFNAKFIKFKITYVLSFSGLTSGDKPQTQLVGYTFKYHITLSPKEQKMQGHENLYIYVFQVTSNILCLVCNKFAWE